MAGNFTVEPDVLPAAGKAIRSIADETHSDVGALLGVREADAGANAGFTTAATKAGSPSTSVITRVGYDAPPTIPQAISADPDDHGPLGRITRYAEYVVTGVPAAELDHRFDAVPQWWRGNGFRMALQANERGELFLTSTSPCVWPGGTPS